MVLELTRPVEGITISNTHGVKEEVIMTTVRLDYELENKLATLMGMENCSKSELIKRAIEEYYASHINKKSPWEVGEDLFAYQSSGDPSLSKNYKQKLTEILNEKHSH